jgi:hypothetical protein
VSRTLLALLLMPAFALAAPVPKAGKDESRLYMTIGKKVISIAPDGTDEKTVCDKGEGYDELSPDGKWVVGVRHNPGKDRHSLMLREPGGKSKEVLLVSHQSSVLWAADGKSLYGMDQKLVEGGKGGLVAAGRQCWRYELDSGKQTMLDIPEKYTIRSETPGGKQLLCSQTTGTKRIDEQTLIRKSALVITAADKFEPKVLIADEVDVFPMAMFPDGKRWLVGEVTPYMHDIGVFTLGEKKPVWWGLKAHFAGCAVSPNGKRVAYWLHHDQDEKTAPKREEYELWVADADGKNAIKIYTADKWVNRLHWR